MNTITNQTADEIHRRFTYHPPKDGQPARYEEIRNRAQSFALRLCELCPESRELSRALTALEDVCFNANAAIARRE